LAALEKITYHPLEIIIVNDGSIDGTREFLDSLSIAQVSIIHNEKNSGLSSSRNRGIKHARYDVVAFTDDDCEPDSEWILHLMQGFDEKNVGLVIGQTFYIAQDYQGYFPERLVQNKLARWPMGCNCAYRKKVFDTIGYFEDEYFFYNNEDSEMAIRAVSQGWHHYAQNEVTKPLSNP
jgi:glycosyltransferase involved in cell wall biosynthesis